jgi:hypothetical protein
LSIVLHGKQSRITGKPCFYVRHRVDATSAKLAGKPGVEVVRMERKKKWVLTVWVGYAIIGEIE